MPGVETLIAAAGGLVLGAGLAMAALDRARRADRRRALEQAALVRRVIVPLLEKHAERLGVPSAERGAVDDPPVVTALALATAIRRREDVEALPFTDTLEVARETLRSKRGAEGA